DLTIDRELHEVRCRPPREYRKTREMGEPFCQRVRVNNVTTAVQHETRPCSCVRFPRDFPKVRTADLLSTLNRTHWLFAGHPAGEVAGLLLIARSTEETVGPILIQTEARTQAQQLFAPRALALAPFIRFNPRNRYARPRGQLCAGDLAGMPRRCERPADRLRGVGGFRRGVGKFTPGAFHPGACRGVCGVPVER